MDRTRLGCSLLFTLAALLGGCPSNNACEDICPDGGADAPLADAPLDAPLGADVPTGEDAPVLGTDAPAEDAPPSANEVIGRRCGPADGFALELGIFQRAGDSCTGDPSARSLTFFIHDLGGASLPPTAGSTVTSTTARANGNASECPGGSPPCRTSDTWSVTFDTYEADVSATGSYTITWGDGSSSTGNFDATWCETGPIICG